MRRIWFMVLLLLLVGAGCAQTKQEEQPEYTVYFADNSGDASFSLVGESHVLPEDTDPIEGLLDLLLAGPTRGELTRTVPSGARVQKWNLENGLLTVDFSVRYSGLAGIELTLADYSVVLTMTQLPEVKSVMITVNGSGLSYRDHQILTAEDVPRDIFQEGAAAS